MTVPEKSKKKKTWKDIALERLAKSKKRSTEIEKESKKEHRQIKPVYIGARNPYALANAINKEPILWKEFTPDRIGKLMSTLSILNIKNKKKSLVYEKLFDPVFGSPLFTRKKFTPKKHSTKNDFVSNRSITKASVSADAPWVLACTLFAPVWGTIAGAEQIADAPRVDAPIQGCPPDCWVVSALSSIAWADTIPIEGLFDPSYIEVADIEQDIHIPASGIPTNSIPIHNAIPAYAHSQFNELWPSTFEYHMTELVAPNNKVLGQYPDIPSIGSGDPQFACSCISLGPLDPDCRKTAINQTELDADDTWDILHDTASFCYGAGYPTTFNKTRYPTVAWTYCTSAGAPLSGCTAENRAPTAVYNDEILVASHAYSILGTMGSKKPSDPNFYADPGFVILRNPWGGILDAHATYYHLHAPETRTYTLASPLTIHLYPGEPDTDYLPLPVMDGSRLVRDGIFGLRIDDFVKYFAGYGWVVPP